MLIRLLNKLLFADLQGIEYQLKASGLDGRKIVGKCRYCRSPELHHLRYTMNGMWLVFCARCHHDQFVKDPLLYSAYVKRLICMGIVLISLIVLLAHLLLFQESQSPSRRASFHESFSPVCPAGFSFPS